MLVLGSSATTPSSGAAVDRQEQLVTVDEDSSLWPYTSSATKFEERTLALNVVVAGDPADTRRHLKQRSRGGWNETAPEQEDVSAASSDEAVGTSTAWGSADGSTRYVYVASDDDPSSGRWLDESYQLHDGEYLGSRHHIRAYASPDDGDEWTAMQAHREHWDWFRLSHTVTSAEDSQQYVEREFMGRRYVSNVSRDYLGNDRGFDSDGWVTSIEIDTDVGNDGDDTDDGSPVHLAMIGLLPGALLGGRVASRTVPREFDSLRVRHSFLLAGSLIGLYLFVRFGAIAVEARLGSLDPRFIAGAFYPLLVIGLPVCTYYFARPLDRPTAFAVSSVGFATAILLDYTALGVTRLPVTVFVHRFSTAIALGFIAVGASHAERIDPEDHGFVRMGALLWGVTLLVPLLRFL
ncbi:hypothetical protein HYG81_02020 [Natrinema zhouii]|uniref:hypothetical protein n=1 Tax=Natrinema zhouii TaxID=1710539 RepID=UPI001CF7CAD0|nr:hypothetical protein [Natrinema zhouii]QLK27786.2 hypothetical protein HYG81_02020 [Natrinema zhouii]